MNCIIHSNKINESNLKQLENWLFEEQTLKADLRAAEKLGQQCPESRQ